MQLKEQADIAAFRQGLERGHGQVLSTVARSLTPLQALSDPALGLRELLQADGLALHLEGQWRVLGDVPDRAALDTLLDWLATQDTRLHVTEALGAEYPPAVACWQLA